MADESKTLNKKSTLGSVRIADEVVSIIAGYRGQRDRRDERRIGGRYR